MNDNHFGYPENKIKIKNSYKKKVQRRLFELQTTCTNHYDRPIRSNYFRSTQNSYIFIMCRLESNLTLLKVCTSSEVECSDQFTAAAAGGHAPSIMYGLEVRVKPE